MDKNKKTFQVPTLLAFAAIVAIMVIVGVRVLNVPVVPMCLLVIIEAVIAVMLHHAELWVHGLLILAELCAGVAGKKTVLIILCAVVYIAATFALQIVLGDHVEQQGSYQDGARTRFDFSHGQAMTAEELAKVEALVNEKIAEDIAVVTDVMNIEDAKKSGAMALFGEKYGETVRVVSMGDFSRELCGGTHVKHTGEIGYFKILSESGVAAGVRRIEALTGANVMAYYQAMEESFNKAAAAAKATPAALTEKIQHMQAELKALNAENESLKAKMAQSALGDVLDQVVEVKGTKLLATSVDGVDMNGLRDLGDQLKDKLGEGVVVLLSAQDGKVNMIAMATDGAVKAGAHAGNLIKGIAALVGGGGGGRPNMAQAGGKNPAGIPAAIAEASKVLEGQLA